MQTVRPALLLNTHGLGRVSATRGFVGKIGDVADLLASDFFLCGSAGTIAIFILTAEKTG